MKTHKNIDGRIRITLEESDFGDLVRGGTVGDIVDDGPPIEICLADIGYERLRYLIPESPLCPHGEYPSECQACMVEGDFQHDAAREIGLFRGPRGRD